MMNEFKDIIHKEVITFLNESARIITEKWSYSESIDEYTEYIYNTVEKTIGNAEYHSLSNDIKLYANEVNVEIYGIKMPFYYLCYNCRNEEACQNAHEHLDSKNGYNETIIVETKKHVKTHMNILIVKMDTTKKKII